MARLRSNWQRGSLTGAITSGATSITSGEFSALPVVASPDYLVIVLDPEAQHGNPEFIKVTAHSSSSTTVTATRGHESSTARSHQNNVEWRHVPTAGGDYYPSGGYASLVANQIPVDGTTPVGALVNTLMNDLSSAGGGVLLGDAVGTAALETPLVVPSNVQLWVPSFSLVWKATSAMDYMIRVVSAGSVIHHSPGYLNGNSLAVEGIRAERSGLTFFTPLITGCTSYGFRSSSYGHTLISPRLTGNAYGVALDTGNVGASGSNGFRIFGGELSNTSADLTVITGGGQVITGQSLTGTLLGCPAISVDIPTSSGVSDFVLRECRYEPSTVSSSSTRVVRNLDSNAFGIRITGGSFAASSSGKADYLFELEGGDHVISDAILSNYNTAVVKGLAGFRRATIGDGCQYTGTLVDNTLVSNKNRQARWETNSDQRALLLGDGTAPLPSFSFATDRTTGLYLDAANHRLYITIQGTAVGYFDATGLH